MSVVEQIDFKQEFLSGIQPSAIVPLQEKEISLEALSLMQFPTKKDEYWKYANVATITKGQFVSKPSTAHVDITPYKIPNLDAYRIVFVNGFLRTDLSDDVAEAGLICQNIGDTAVQDNAVFQKHFNQVVAKNQHIFNEMNTAFATGGLFITAEKNVVVSKPIHIIHISTEEGAFSVPRHLIVAQQSSQLKVVSSFKSTTTAATFTNAVAELVVEPNAHLDYNKIQYELDQANQVSSDFVYQFKDSVYNGNTITLNGAWVRNNLSIALDGENCDSRLFGLYPIKGNQFVDNHTLVDHRKPNCLSNELYKGIADGNSTGVFNGKVFVRQDAQKTNAFQQNNNIILSDSGAIFAKPELEIYADDVKCSHGCTIGQFDEEAVFYLRSRGISEQKARNLMVYAFAEEVLDNITIEPLKIMVESLMAERFQW